MSKNYLDKDGLSYFWSKLKTILNGKANTSDLASKQDTLVSGTNIKTINGASVVGSGDLTVEGTPEVAISTTQPVNPTKIWINPNEVITGSGFELNKMYPVGSLYFNTTGVNPSTFLGGTWESFGAGKVLVGQDTNDTDFDTLLETGGEKTHNHDKGSYFATMRVNGNDIQFKDTAHNWTSNFQVSGSNSQVVSINQGYAISVEGTSGTSSNMQPYIVVSIWVRTA